MENCRSPRGTGKGHTTICGSWMEPEQFEAAHQRLEKNRILSTIKRIRGRAALDLLLFEQRRWTDMVEKSCLSKFRPSTYLSLPVIKPVCFRPCRNRCSRFDCLECVSTDLARWPALFKSVLVAHKKPRSPCTSILFEQWTIAPRTTLTPSVLCHGKLQYHWYCNNIEQSCTLRDGSKWYYDTIWNGRSWTFPHRPDRSERRNESIPVPEAPALLCLEV